MKQADLPDSKTFEAILASLLLWLLGILAAFIELFPKHVTRNIAAIVRANLHIAEYDTKRAILGLAILRMRMPNPKHAHHPTPGFALRRMHGSPIRLFTHATFNARPLKLRARIERLRDILDNIETWTARLQKRLERGFNAQCCILAAPPTARTFTACTPSPLAADSS